MTMPVRRVLVVVSAALAAAVVLGACGEERESERARTVSASAETTAGAQGTRVATVRVSETEFALAPRNPRVARAGIIAFEVANEGDVVHALEVEGPAGEVKSPAIGPGQRSAIKVDLPPGTYKWYCPIGDHEQRGMVGRVRVAE